MIALLLLPAAAQAQAVKPEVAFSFEGVGIHPLGVRLRVQAYIPHGANSSLRLHDEARSNVTERPQAFGSYLLTAHSSRDSLTPHPVIPLSASTTSDNGDVFIDHEWTWNCFQNLPVQGQPYSLLGMMDRAPGLSPTSRFEALRTTFFGWTELENDDASLHQKVVTPCPPLHLSTCFCILAAVSPSAQPSICCGQAFLYPPPAAILVDRLELFAAVSVPDDFPEPAQLVVTLTRTGLRHVD